MKAARPKEPLMQDLVKNLNLDAVTSTLGTLVNCTFFLEV